MDNFRVCEACMKPMTEGYTVDGGFWYCCEDCFEKQMDISYPHGWRANAHVEDELWCDGYYDFLSAIDGEWHDTGIYYTEWD